MRTHHKSTIQAFSISWIEFSLLHTCIDLLSTIQSSRSFLRVLEVIVNAMASTEQLSGVLDEVRSVRRSDDDHVLQLFEFVEFDQVRSCETTRSPLPESPPPRPRSAAIVLKNTSAFSRAFENTARTLRLTLRRTCSEVPAL